MTDISHAEGMFSCSIRCFLTPEEKDAGRLVKRYSARLPQNPSGLPGSYWTVHAR
jgi:hypothetical protein